MTDQELQKLLALKRLEMPSPERLQEVETLFRYNLRLERMKQKASPGDDVFLLPAWVVRWSPVVASVVVILLGAVQINKTAEKIVSAERKSAPTSPVIMQPLQSTPLFDFFSEGLPEMPVAAPLTRSFAVEATPVVFDESRITY